MRSSSGGMDCPVKPVNDSQIRQQTAIYVSKLA